MKKILLILCLLLCFFMVVGCDSDADTDVGDPVDGNTVTVYYRLTSTATELLSVNVEKGGVITLSPLPTQPYYTFRGLFDDSGAMFVDENGAGQIVVNESITLHCEWAPLTYELVFDAMEGTLDAASTTLAVTYGEELGLLPIPSRTGYDFVGWYHGNKQISKGAEPVENYEKLLNPFYIIKDDKVQLTAAYELKKLTITFAFNDGSYEEQTRTATYGSKLEKGAYPQKDTGSAMIVGWSEVIGGTSNFDRIFTEEITLYAIWEQYVNITFCEVGSTATKTEKLFEGDTLTLYEPTRTGYTFDGWYKNKEFTGNPVEELTYSAGNTMLYAKWILIEQRAVLYPNNGSTMPSITYNIESDFTLPVPQKENYVFLGWCFEGDCSDTPFTELPLGTFGINALYAKYRGEDRTVNLNAGSAALSETTVTVEYNAAFTLPVPTLAGYAFVGWFDAPDEGAVCYTDKNGEGLARWTGEEDSVTLYAQFKKKLHITVAHALPEASTCKTNTYYVAGEQVALTAVAKNANAYALVGWYIDGELVSESATYTFTMGEADVALELRFRPKQFTVTLKTAKGEFCSATSATLTYKEPFTLPIAYKQGYLFTGWKWNSVTLTDENGASESFEYYRDLVLTPTFKENAGGDIFVYDADSLQAMKDNPKGHYLLVLDVDMKGYDWQPFAFSGSFNGNDHVIKNLSVTAATGNLGMFTTVSGTVKDLTLEGLSVTSTSYQSVLVGGVCAELTGTLTGVTVKGTVTGDFCRIGGIAGKVSGTVENCINYATVTSETLETAISAGGITGLFASGSITECKNYGTVSIDNNAGGIIGYAQATGCSALENNGDVTGEVNVGGIIGYFAKSGDYTLTLASTNRGNVTGETYVGGVLGRLVNEWTEDSSKTHSLKINKLTNSGKVEGVTYVGGVVGGIRAIVNAKYGYNNPSIIVTANGFANTGDVAGTTYVGGIVGYAYSDNGGSQLSNSSSTAKITAEAYVGGLAGKLENVKLIECTNTDTVLVATSYAIDGANYYAYVGGFVGYGYYVENCHNAVEITYTEGGSYVGGIAGRLLRPLQNCSNTANVTAANASYVGGLVGEVCSSGDYSVLQLTNSGNVKGKNYVGGVLGRIWNEWTEDSSSSHSLKISKLTNSGKVEGVTYVGGVVGNVRAIVNPAYGYNNPSIIVTANGFANTGDVTGTTYVGGLMGYAYSDNGNSQLSNSGSTAKITAESYVGGLAGRLENIRLIECTNTDTVLTATGYTLSGSGSYAYVGGFVGYGYYVENCHNAVEITYTEGGSYVGGIAGRLLHLMQNCSNTANVTAANASYVGGLVGEICRSGDYTVSQLTNSGNVKGKDYVGGVIGRLANEWTEDSSKTHTLGINKLTNNGKVEGAKYVGGIMGAVKAVVSPAYGYNNPSIVVVANSFTNTGDVTGTTYVAGLIAQVYTDNSSSALTVYTSTGTVTGGSLTVANATNFKVNE